MTHIRAAALCAAVGLTLGVGHAAQAASAGVMPATSPGWAPTATHAMVPRGAFDLGRAPRTLPMSIVVGLKQRDPLGAKGVLRAQRTPGNPYYHHLFSVAEYTARFNASGAQVAAVANYLVREGFTNVHAAPNNLLITADGNPASVERAFNTQIRLMRVATTRGNAVIYTNVAPASVPAQLGGDVSAVLGLHDLPMRTFMKYAPPAIQARTAARFAHAMQVARLRHIARAREGGPAEVTGSPQPCLVQAPNYCSREYGIYDFNAAYNGLAYNNTLGPGTINQGGPSRLVGASTTGFLVPTAIFAEGKVDQVLTDLSTYEQMFGAQYSFPVSVEYVGAKSNDTSGQDEFDLDTQTSTAMAYGVQHLYIYVATNLTDAATSTEFNQFVTDHYAAAGSASFGEPEASAMLDGAETVDDAIFDEGDGQGQTFFASAGDTGGSCAVVINLGAPGEGVPGVCYPAASPFITAVGGTTMLSGVSNASYGGEVAWDAGGGGLSVTEPPSSFQAAALPAEDTGDGMFRSVPDISMDADNNISPAIVVVSGKAEGVGGTSLSSPLALGAWARLLTANPGDFGVNGYNGYLDPALYTEYTTYPEPTVPSITSPTGGFPYIVNAGYNDEITGCNVNGGSVCARPGYDQATGLGSLDIERQTKFIDVDGDGDAFQRR